LINYSTAVGGFFTNFSGFLYRNISFMAPRQASMGKFALYAVDGGFSFKTNFCN